MAAISTIVVSYIIGKKSFHNKPLVIHVSAVAENTAAAIFSSALIFPSLCNCLEIIFFSSINEIVLLLIFTPTLTIYNQVTNKVTALIGIPTNIQSAKFTFTL